MSLAQKKAEREAEMRAKHERVRTDTLRFFLGTARKNGQVEVF